MIQNTKEMEAQFKEERNREYIQDSLDGQFDAWMTDNKEDMQESYFDDNEEHFKEWCFDNFRDKWFEDMKDDFESYCRTEWNNWRDD